MNKKINCFSYLVSLFFFKLAVGATLLVVGWDSLTLSNNPLKNISLIMALSFMPAAFAKPLYNRFVFCSFQKFLALTFFGSALLILIEVYFFSIHSSLIFIINFILWIFIFLSEVLCEKWFVALSQNKILADIRRLSGLSISIGQIGVILGPVLVIAVKPYSDNLIYWLISSIFVFSSISPLFVARISDHDFRFESSKPSNVHLVQKSCANRYVFAFALIWPTLAIFNITAPLLSKTEYHSIGMAGVMEFLIGSATVLMGFLHPIITNFIKYQKRLLLMQIIMSFFALLLYFIPMVSAVVYVSTFCIGLTFGYLRIELRSFFSKRYDPKIAGEIIASANSWSGFLVLMYCLLFYFSSYYGVSDGITFVFPLAFIVASTIFSLILFLESKNLLEVM